MQVILRLPWSPHEQVAVADEIVQGETGGDGRGALVMEDDPQARILIPEVLCDLGLRAIEESDPESASASLQREGHIGLLVSNVELPGVNGRRRAEIARRERPGPKVLFMTGYASEAAAPSEFLGAGMDMLTKPFTLESRTSKIRQMVFADEAETGVCKVQGCSALRRMCASRMPPSIASAAGLVRRAAVPSGM